MLLVHVLQFGLLACIASIRCEHVKRQFETILNPDCPPSACDGNDDDVLTMVHIRAIGPSDIVHHLWSFIGAPSVLQARTDHNVTLRIDYTQFISGDAHSVRFVRDTDRKTAVRPSYTSVLVLQRLIEYNDTIDAGRLIDASVQQPIRAFRTRNIGWSRVHLAHSPEFARLEMIGTHSDWFGAAGRLRLVLKAFGQRESDADAPHMLHSENGTQITVQLDQLRSAVWPNGSDPPAPDEWSTGRRYAVELVQTLDGRAENASDASAEMLVVRQRSLDDEHTPGVFEMIDVRSPASERAPADGNGTYVHFRPVVYTDRTNAMSVASEAHVAERVLRLVANWSDNLPNDGELAWSYFGEECDRQLRTAYNVSFGRNGDGFYAKSGYSAWSFQVALGQPPDEEMSAFVLVIATLGLGLPVLLLMCAGICVCVRSIRRQRRERFSADFY